MLDVMRPRVGRGGHTQVDLIFKAIFMLNTPSLEVHFV